MSHEYDLVVRRDFRQEREERLVIMVEVKDGVRVREVDASAGEIEGGGFESCGEKKSDEFIPAPTTVAGSMNKHKVNYWRYTTVASHRSLSNLYKFSSLDFSKKINVVWSTSLQMTVTTT